MNPESSVTLDQIRSMKGHAFVLDVETTGLRWWSDKLIGVGVHCPALDISGYFFTCTYEDLPVGKERSKLEWKGKMDYSKSARGRRVKERVTYQDHAPGAVPNEELIAAAKEACLEACDDPKSTLIGHNLKFDAHFLDLKMWELPCKVVDTTIMVHLYDSRLKKAMGAAEEEFLFGSSKRDLVSEAQNEIPKKFKKKFIMWPADAIATYCINDCIVTYQLMETLVPLLKEDNLVKLFWLQCKWLRVLQKMERRGMKTDPEWCQAAVDHFTETLSEIEKELFEKIGYEFNWRSFQQVHQAFYTDYGWPVPVNPYLGEDGVDRTRFAHRGHYNTANTSSFVLMEKAKHPLAQLLLDLRETAKMRNYVNQYLDFRDEDNLIHSTFRITGTRTGRLSSGDPNLQNIPSEHRVRETQSEYTGGAIRSMFYNLRQALVSREGYTLLSIDHKQQEARLFGILMNDESMLEIMRTGEDLHLSIAKRIWGDCGPERNKLHREWSKTITFGLIYGMTTGALEHRLGLTREEAMSVSEEYWNTFTQVRPFLQGTMEEVHVNGFIRYWSGRIWREDNPDDYYKGANAAIQGGAADFLSVVLLRANEVLEATGWGELVSIIHDEALFEIKQDKVEIAAKVLSRTMEGEDIFGLRFLTDAKVGPSYGSMTDYDIEVPAELDWRAYLNMHEGAYDDVEPVAV